MNNDELFTKLLKDYQISDIHWKSSESDEDSVLFYKVGNGEDALDLFNQRVQESSYQCIITNLKIDTKFDHIYFTASEEDFLDLQKKFLDKLYPTKEAKYIAVTGTNGKTSCVDFLRQLLISKEKSVLSVGTLGVYSNESKVEDFHLTTPSYIDLRKCLTRYPADFVLFEASSHAIEQKRFFKIIIDSAIWTSFSQDHLDYHGDMQSYYQAKLELSKSLKPGQKILITNEDEELHREHLDNFKLVTPKLRPEQDFLKVDFNKKNLELAIASLESFGFDFSSEDLKLLKPVPGRFNTYRIRNKLFIIDYAHTPDAIENICRSVSLTFKDEKLLTLFGCGGNRDKLKRPLMGKAACGFSDYVFVTTDNPRFEEPEDIIEDIVAGLSEFNNYKTIVDRKLAIKEALDSEYEVILIAGKGHEDYMDIKGEKLEYSDVSELMRYKNA